MPFAKSVSRLTGLFLVLAAASAIASGPGRADTHLADVSIDYDLTISGAGAAEISLQAELRSDSYRIGGEGRTVGLIDLIAQMRFSGTTSGAVNSGDLKPATHVHDYSERSRARHVKLTYDRSGKPAISAKPPFDPSLSRVPLPESKIAGVLDPVSVFVAPAVPGHKPLSAAQCERSFAVFDGRIRVDMRMSYLGTEPAGSLRGSNYAGPVLRCRAFVQPIGGHKKEAFLTKLSRARDIEVWLAPAAAGNYLVPVRLSLPTPIGRAELLARRLIDKPAAKHASLSD